MLKVMTSYALSIITLFQIWACHMTNVGKLSRNLMSSSLFQILGKLTKYQFYTFVTSLVILFSLVNKVVTINIHAFVWRSLFHTFLSVLLHPIIQLLCFA